jgi:hypothetical protein
MSATLWDIFFLWFYLINYMCVSISTIVWLDKKIHLINKVIEYNWVNIPCYEIKYLDLHSPLDFSRYVFNYR